MTKGSFSYFSVLFINLHIRYIVPWYVAYFKNGERIQYQQNPSLTMMYDEINRASHHKIDRMKGQFNRH